MVKALLAVTLACAVCAPVFAASERAIAVQCATDAGGQFTTLRWSFAASKVVVSGGSFGAGKVVTGQSSVVVRPYASTQYNLDVWFRGGPARHVRYSIVVGVGPGNLMAPRPPMPRPIARTADSMENVMRRVVELTNIERAKAGLAPVKLHEGLCAGASWMARDMAEHDYFSHVDRSGRTLQTRLPACGYNSPTELGENLAGGQATAEEVVAEWMQSPGHRANMLNPRFSEVGVGAFLSLKSRYQSYWVLDFGSRRDVYPVVINGEAARTASSRVRLYIYGSNWARKMRLSNDGVNWTGWRRFASQCDWDLEAGDGARTVYVEMSNGDATMRTASSIGLGDGAG